jgi:hypothetical protein
VTLDREFHAWISLEGLYKGMERKRNAFEVQQQPRVMHRVWIPSLVLLFLVGCASVPETATVPDHTLRGVALSPKSFSATDFPAFFEKAKVFDTITGGDEATNLANEHGSANIIMRLSTQYDYTPIIIVGINKDTKATDVVTFVTEHHPPFLGIGNEINFKKGDLIAKVNEINAAIKAVSPDTQTFTVIQYETLLGRNDGLFGGARTQPNWALLDSIETDMIAFTTYPGLIYNAPEALDPNYYTQIKEHTTKRVAFSETGWFRDGPTGWPSDADEQARFASWFLEHTKELNPRFVIWTFLYDQAIEAPFSTMGLLKDTETSPAFDVWTS